jgi:hypothetical protein
LDSSSVWGFPPEKPQVTLSDRLKLTIKYKQSGLIHQEIYPKEESLAINHETKTDSIRGYKFDSLLGAEVAICAFLIQTFA